MSVVRQPYNQSAETSTDAMIDANMRLASEFFAAAFDDPSLLDGITADATLVLIPFDEPELARANVEAAIQEAERGKHVEIRIVGLPMPEAQGWAASQAERLHVRPIRPRWPGDLKTTLLTLHYYRDTDLMYATIRGDRGPGVPLPWRGPTFLLIDLETEEVQGYLIPRFLSAVVPEAPRLVDWLRRAEIHETTPANLAKLLPVAPTEPDDHTAIERVLAELGDALLAS